MSTVPAGHAASTARTALAILLASLIAIAAASDAAANGVDHKVTILNRCSQQVWIATNGSGQLTVPHVALAPRCTAANAATVCTTGTCHKGSCTCQTDADCAFGSTADTTATCDTGRNRCVNKVKIQVPATWGGRFWARTGCSGTDSSFVCESGQCGPPTGGNIDCFVQGADSNLATLFELSGSGVSASDNFDVSLVSGYNVPMTVKVVLPPDAPVWHASTSYGAGAQIVERTKAGVFGYTNTGAGGTSGATKPHFPRKWGHESTDAPGVVWRNTGPACATSGCRRTGIPEAQCPTLLKELSSGTYVGCNAPSNVCDASDPNCPYFQCKNVASGAPTDLFGNEIGLQSANGATYVCYSSDDCAPGSRCLIDPEFASGVTVPSGSGVCVPVSQNNQCDSASDDDPCPGIAYPYVGYTCQTLSKNNAKVCLPPTVSGLGDIWWNAANWTDTSTGCSTTNACAGGQQCLASEVQKGLRECAASDSSCTCFTPSACTSTSDCQGTGECLDSTGAPCSTGTCYCSPQATYSGACGATNQAWVDAGATLTSDAGTTWPQGFRASCPIAYGYQFDDPASNWFCPNGSTNLNGYRVVLCGGEVR